MSQIERINFYNTWPNGQRFIAEQQFEEHLKSVGGNFFTPIALNNNLSATGHISLSYTLDSLDSLPMRPDHAFDWIWKAFEHLTKAAAPNLNITDSLRTFATPTICSVLTNYPQASVSFNQLAANIPLQSSRFLLKKWVLHESDNIIRQANAVYEWERPDHVSFSPSPLRQIVRVRLRKSSRQT